MTLKINQKIDRLDTMQNLFKYWHVVHSPFALIMLVIMLIHVAVTIVFGYRWIFLNMELLIENILIYSLVAILCIVVVIIYLRKKSKASKNCGGKNQKS